MSTNRRIIKDINDDKYFYHDLNFSFWPNNPDDIFSCTGVIMGPKDSVYDGGIFFVDIQYPQYYPFKPPNITFITKIYNPCINSKGKISLDIIEDQFTPALTVPKILVSIQSLLLDFDADSPLVPEIAYQYKYERSKYDYIAREWTALFAM